MGSILIYYEKINCKLTTHCDIVSFWLAKITKLLWTDKKKLKMNLK